MPWFLGALATGLSVWLSLPPFELSFLAWLSLIPALYFIRLSSSRLETFAISFSSAFIPIAGIGYSLIPFSVPFYFFILLFVPACFGFLGCLYKATCELVDKRWISRILIVPVFWTLFEFLLTESPLSLPLNYAITQSSHPALIQLAGFGGIYLVSFFILLVNALLTEVLILFGTDQRRMAAVCLGSTTLIFLTVVLHGRYRMALPVIPERTLQIASIQPVISSEDYRDHWIDPKVRMRVRGLFETLTSEAVSQKPLDLVVWPEGGNGFYNFRIPELRARLSKLAAQSSTSLLISSLDLDEQGNKFNSVFSVGPKGELIDRVNKIKLTPIGEETFKPGDELRPLATGFGPVGILVCFESSFSSLARKLKNRGAELLFITTSDAPFRNSVFPLLHASMAVFRAVENGTTVVRTANTGPSMVVDPWGRRLAQTGFYSRGIMRTSVPLYKNGTFYSRYGNSWLVIPGLFFFT